MPGDGGLLDELEADPAGHEQDPVVERQLPGEQAAADELVERVVAADVLAQREERARRVEQARRVEPARSPRTRPGPRAAAPAARAGPPGSRPGPASPSTHDQGRRTAGRVQTIVVVAIAVVVIAVLAWSAMGGRGRLHQGRDRARHGVTARSGPDAFSGSPTTASLPRCRLRGSLWLIRRSWCGLRSDAELVRPTTATRRPVWVSSTSRRHGVRRGRIPSLISDASGKIASAS